LRGGVQLPACVRLSPPPQDRARPCAPALHPEPAGSRLPARRSVGAVLRPLRGGRASSSGQLTDRTAQPGSVRAKVSARRLPAGRGYGRLLVPLDLQRESLDALAIACRLAADDGARITAVAVIEVPAQLPLDAHFRDQEEAARRLLERAEATGDTY